MLKTLITAVFLFAILTNFAWAQKEKAITLNDGSRIQGHVVGLENSRYIVKSQTLGEVQIHEDDINAITEVGEAPATNSKTAEPSSTTQSGDYTQEMIHVQNQITSNPALMEDIQAMANDPEILAIITDPAFMQAAKAGNLQNLQNDPRMQRLINNPRMKNFITKFQDQQM